MAHDERADEREQLVTATPAQQAWSAFRPILIARLGEQRVADLEAAMTDARRILGEPQAVMQLMVSTIEEAFRVAPPTPQELVAFASIASQVGPMHRHDPAIEPARDAMAALLANAAAIAGEEVVAAMVAPLLEPNWLTDVIASGSDGLLDAGGFERRMSILLRNLVKASESYYKPFLRVALQATWAARGETKNAANELGALMAQCANAWDADLQAALLLPDLALVRNSEAHGHTLYDSPGAAVTFANVKKDGTRVECRITDDEFQRFFRAFQVRAMGMHHGCVAWQRSRPL